MTASGERRCATCGGPVEAWTHTYELGHAFQPEERRSGERRGEDRSHLARSFPPDKYQPLRSGSDRRSPSGVPPSAGVPAGEGEGSGSLVERLAKKAHPMAALLETEADQEDWEDALLEARFFLLAIADQIDEIGKEIDSEGTLRITMVGGDIYRTVGRCLRTEATR